MIFRMQKQPKLRQCGDFKGRHLFSPSAVIVAGFPRTSDNQCLRHNAIYKVQAEAAIWCYNKPSFRVLCIKMKELQQSGRSLSKNVFCADVLFNQGADGPLEYKAYGTQ
ncbi:hypothetical protein Anapl_11545 [Anas platyrhynchos]|uniref:Uncharacterized protein n=1 Tax=Anas platyrhynchos TaxID=8839 RepID=R0L033_ANAPL|nr:hypothetical protein Anapl_11545 [Anas platyrhynchos]